MAMERFNEGMRSPAEAEFRYTPSRRKASQVKGIADFSVKENAASVNRVIEDDRFSYFTLIEAILIYNILYEKLPKGKLGFSFATKKLLKKENALEGHLVIFKGEKEVKKYRIIYDIKRSFFDIFDGKNKRIGEIDFELVGEYNNVEEARGKLEGVAINLDPVWDRFNKNRIKYQVLKIGHRKLDLTPRGKGNRYGHWSFQGLEEPVGFEVMFSSFEGMRDHVKTRKKIKIGKSVLEMELRFIDDRFPEPYDGDGVVVVGLG